MAFVLFQEENVDAAVLEVGLGGRLDATNVVTPLVSVITRVDYDHEAYLGKNLEDIAAEKAGILKPGVPAIFASQRSEVERALEARAAALGAPVSWTFRIPVTGLDVHRDGCRFEAAGVRVECPLAGAHQVENALTAVAVLRRLGIATEAIARGIRAVRWPGRLDRVPGNPEVILDGAHNPCGARVLADHIRTFYADRRITLIFGSMRDKAVAEMSAILFPLAETVIATAPRQPRAVRPETMRSLADHPDLRVVESLEQALALAAGADVVFVTGSLFLVAEAVALLTPEQRNKKADPSLRSG